ncbi:unnamed protein product, partial [Ectocarpus sp. 12 AP-2014]
KHPEQAPEELVRRNREHFLSHRLIREWHSWLHKRVSNPHQNQPKPAASRSPCYPCLGLVISGRSRTSSRDPPSTKLHPPPLLARCHPLVWTPRLIVPP